LSKNSQLNVFSANQRPASIYIMYVWTMVNSMAPMLSI